MKPLLLAASALLSQNQAGVYAVTHTSFIDLHLVTSFVKTGSVESGYLFRIPSAESSFGSSPPKAPKWTSHTPLSTGEGNDEANLEAIGQSGYPSHQLMVTPEKDTYLCNEANGVSDYADPTGETAADVFDKDTHLSGFEGSYILVPRGGCTFEAKARSAQRLGASGVIVRNTLESRYGLVDGEDTTTTTNKNKKDGGPVWSNTKWPTDRVDFECGKDKEAVSGIGWRAEIETSKLGFNPSPYDASTNDILLAGRVAGNLCAGEESDLEHFGNKCPSERCLLTGRNASDDGSRLEACCAWDDLLRMGTDGDDGENVAASKRTDEEEDIVIPALFVDMKNGEELYELVVDAGKNSNGDDVQVLTIVPYGRWYPSTHHSSAVVWLLTMFTLWISVFMSAKEYRYSWKKISDAAYNGVLVFKSATNSNTTGRERASTDDTVESDESVELVMTQTEMELAPLNDGAVTTAADTQQSDTPATAQSDAPELFAIAGDDHADEDDFVGGYNDLGGYSPPDSPLSNSSTTNDNSLANEETSPLPSSSSEASDDDASPSPEHQRANLCSQCTAAVHSVVITITSYTFYPVVFILAAAAFIFVLTFLGSLHKMIRLIYGLSGSMAMDQLLFRPVYHWLSSRLCGKGASNKLQSTAFGNLPGCSGDSFHWIDVISSLTSYSVGITWVVVGLTRVQPMQHTFYWLVQDVMGVCFCVLILGLFHINKIMVTSTFLFLVFIYNLFHAFTSPYDFAAVDVATGGEKVDPTYCEKYPFDSDCRGSFAPLPMMLAVPWFNDFRAEFSVVGLADIILPGLLISFAARFDAAKALVRKCSQASSIRKGEINEADDAADSVGLVGANDMKQHYHLGRIFKSLFRGYFGPLMIAYGVGLTMAYIASWATSRGQPALLFLIPACLGTTLYLGWKKRELSDLWRGPKIIIKANSMVTVASKIPQERDQTAQTAKYSSLV